jgi:hypothetical protein
MPRNSLASLYPSFTPGKRPPPPNTLRPDMQEQWRQIVGRMPANWFTLEALPILEQLCRCMCYCKDWGVWLDKHDPTTVEAQETARYKLVSTKFAQFSVLMSLLANRLRLTPMSQRDVRNSRAMMGTDTMSPDKPWGDNGDTPTKN